VSDGDLGQRIDRLLSGAGDFPLCLAMVSSYTVVLAVVSLLVVGLGLRDSLLYVFLMPCVLSALFFQRRVYLSMQLLLAAAAVWVTARVSSDFQASLINIATVGASSVLVTEIIHALVAARKRAEEQRTAQLEALREVGLKISAKLDLDTVLRSTASRAVELLGGAAGGLYLYRPDRDVLEWCVPVGARMAPAGTVLQRGEGLAGKVWETGQPLVVEDYQRWEGQTASWSSYPVRAVVSAPVRWGEAFLGVLSIHTDSPGAFSSADAERLSLFASQAAVAIQNARLYQGTRKQLEQLDVLYQVAEAGSRTLELQPLLEGLLDRLLSVSGMEIGAIYQLDQAAQQLHLLVHRGLPSEFADRVQTYVPGEGLTGKALVSGETMICEDAAVVPAVRDKAGLGRLWSQISLPLKVADQVIGVLNLNSKEPRIWAEDDVRWLETVAGQAATAIHNARLYEEIQERRIYLEGVLEAAPDAIVTLDSRHRIREWNPGAERLFGYAEEEVVGQELDQLVTRPDAEAFEEATSLTQKVLAGEPVSPVESVRYRKDGTPVDVILAGAPIVLDDELVGVVAVYTDITKRKRAEQALHRSLREKEVLLQEIHHRVKNNLQVVSSLLSLQSQRTADDEARTILAESRNRVRSMALVHEKLYQSSDLGTIDIGDYLNSLATHLLRVYGGRAKGVAIDIEAASATVSLDTAITCGLVVNELVTNALRHAFPQDGEDRVRITFCSEEDHWVLTVGDEGIGLPSDVDVAEQQADSLGLDLVGLWVRQLQGNVRLDREDGTTFEITFPKSSER
jgi:PAS domain S-box-containing protein